MTTGKTIALTRWTFVGKVMSLLFNMSRLVIAFLPRSKHLLISWLQSPSAVILELKKIKPVTVSIVSPSICHEVIGLDAMICIFLNVEFYCAWMFNERVIIPRSSIDIVTIDKQLSYLQASQVNPLYLLTTPIRWSSLTPAGLLDFTERKGPLTHSRLHSPIRAQH